MFYFIHLGYHFVFYMKVGCPTCVMLSMDKTKGKLRFLLQRPIFSCGFIEYKGPCHLRTFKSTDYL